MEIESPSVPPINEVKAFWDAHPVGQSAIPFPPGTPDYFRYYDGLLDRELARVYKLVEKAPRIWRSPFNALTRQVLRRFMELTEFTERVDNAIKSVGDFWLARVYRASLGRFRVPEWRESVEAKLGLVGRAYEMLKGEVEVSRGQALEIVVILLILVELLAALQRHG